MLDFVEAIRKEMNTHEEYKYWTLVQRMDLYGNKSIISICPSKRNRAPGGRLIKQKARLCAYRGMKKGGVNYWETYSPVVNWMSVIPILTLNIPQNLHTKSVDLVLDYTYTDVKSEIYMELALDFGVDGSHPR